MKTGLKKMIFLLVAFINQFAFSQDYVPTDIRIGDTNINYVNPEISPAGNYMLWIEIDTANGFIGQVWHCGLDPNTGDLIPSNGKGFYAFNSNVYGRPADWGIDSIGPYYIGLNTLGRFVFVRPTSATEADTEILTTPQDMKRRVIYPSQLPNTNKRFITYILNNNQPGGANNYANNSFDLRVLDLDEPLNPMIIETQTRIFPAAVGMDVLVPRWIKGTSYLTYGFYDSNNFVQVKEFDAFNPTSPGLPVTTDKNIKADGYPVENPFNNNQYIISGLNGTDSAIVYKRDSPGLVFNNIETIVPNTMNLINPALSQSHEPFFFNEQLYTTFQINEDGGSFINTTLNEPGEIWVTTIDSSQQTMWLISNYDSTLNVSEPEPYTGNDKIFVYYSANKIDSNNSPLNRIFQLRRCETPMNVTPTSISKTMSQDVKFYPNPTQGIIKIEIDYSNFDILLFNAKGGVVYKSKNQKQIDLKSNPPGIYFLIVKTNELQISKKIIKQ
jgi:hypothetical protein